MRFAYVTLVMLGNNYVKGAVALAKSLHKSGTKHELVCMITNDVTHTRELHKVFDRVVTVPYMFYKCGKFLTERQEQLYSKWIDYSFTKWRCLEMSVYDRCVYLDADQIVLRNIDHLFQWEWAMCFNGNYNALYKSIKCGEIVTDLRNILQNSNVLGFTGTLVFTPNSRVSNCIKYLLSEEKSELLTTPRYNNGHDEIVLAHALANCNIAVRQLSPLYVWNAGEYCVLKNNNQPYVINYYGDKKPWHHKSVFMDMYIWKYFYFCKIKRSYNKNIDFEL
ncbi:glycogenin P13 [Phthorimaea operculella granulovirus]|uniref:Glycogenin P13 n=1 Tax=Phthorimaea operculella granulovirus TaxID=192584 RepID=Q8JS17_9BBAC|nr:glycogenin P13 [Phthorimaea operculella granulovirus]AAM70240.1 glycogenin P13 [Phthorimaea operculella granulovirus]ANY57431.1 glycogenin P13 [Phthorimaea operculella granulovirus]QBH65877.1 glycogenin P13 [Phthorimaea operculella granulovirus]QBH66007.1 glycogenin P13 [Phthorimaea operculella granulovirus]QBH66137.1 glycogenin P13 [Phthorimaea operculella granulovirus]